MREKSEHVKKESRRPPVVNRKQMLEQFRTARARRNRIIKAVLTGILAFLGIAAGIRACHTGAEKKQDNAPIVFALQDRVADALAIVAVRKDFFKAQGLLITPHMFSSGPECTEALTSGDAVFGTMGDATAILLSARRGEAFRIICSHGGGERRHRIMVSTRAGIETIADLAGKKIGVKKGTSTHGGLMMFAEQHDMDLSDALVDLPPSLQLTALATGELDAIVASEPTPSQAEAMGFGRELATLKGLGNTYPVLLAVKAGFARQHPEVVLKVIRALKQAEKFVAAHGNDTARIQANITGLHPDVIRKAMQGHSYSISLDDRVLKSLEVSARFLEKAGRINKLPDFEMVLAPEYMIQSQKN